MKFPELPLDRTDGSLTRLNGHGEQRPTLYRHMEATSAGVATSTNYDSLLDYWHILFRHRKTLLSFVLAGLLGAIAFSLMQTRIYRVRTSLEIQGINDLEMKSPTDSNGSYVTPESYVETQVKLLQSESLLEHVIDKLQLHDERPSVRWRTFALSVVHSLGFAKNTQFPEREELIRQMQSNLTVRTSGNSHLLEVLYESPDPKRAADVANTLVSQFIELSQEERWKAAQGTADWLTKHLDEMKVQLEASETALQNYADTSGLSPTSDKENLAEGKLKELQDELSKAQADRIASQAKFEEAKSKPADSLPEILEDPTMRDYRQKLAELQQQYAELSATLTPQHYKVQRVQAQINELKAEMQKNRGDVLQRIGNEYTSAVRRERLLSQANEVQEKEVADQSAKSIHYDTLKRDVDSNRRL
jgi:succinoglycan biosynthesis transport protein ExoP